MTENFSEPAGQPCYKREKAKNPGFGENTDPYTVHGNAREESILLGSRTAKGTKTTANQGMLLEIKKGFFPAEEAPQGIALGDVRGAEQSCHAKAKCWDNKEDRCARRCKYNGENGLQHEQPDKEGSCRRQPRGACQSQEEPAASYQYTPRNDNPFVH